MSNDFRDFNSEPPDRATDSPRRGPALGNPRRRPRETTFQDIIFLAGFAVGLFVLFVIVASSSTMDWPLNEVLLQWIGKAAGLAMAGLAVLCLLGRTWQGADILDVAPLTLPLLGGILLTNSSWPVALVLGLIVSTAIVCRRFGPRSGAALGPEDD